MTAVARTRVRGEPLRRSRRYEAIRAVVGWKACRVKWTGWGCMAGMRGRGRRVCWSSSRAPFGLSWGSSVA